MNTHIPDEKRIICSLMKNADMISIARMPGGDTEKSAEILQRILRQMNNMNPKTLAKLVVYLSSKYRGCLDSLRKIASENVAKEILQEAIEMSRQPAPR